MGRSATVWIASRCGWPARLHNLLAPDRHAGVVLVERGGRQVVLETHGQLRARGAKVTAKTQFDLGSASEAFTAVLALQAVQTGNSVSTTRSRTT